MYKSASRPQFCTKASSQLHRIFVVSRETACDEPTNIHSPDLQRLGVACEQLTIFYAKRLCSKCRFCINSILSKIKNYSIFFAEIDSLLDMSFLQYALDFSYFFHFWFCRFFQGDLLNFTFFEKLLSITKFNEIFPLTQVAQYHQPQINVIKCSEN